MLVLGLSGGLDLPQQRRDHLFLPGICHDAAAVLVEDGRVVAAFEEERLNRIKHSSKAAVQAIRQCLKVRGARLHDVAQLRYYGSEAGCDSWMRNLFYGSCDAEPVVTFRQLIHEMLIHGVGEDIDDAKICFVNHHLAHAVSAHAQSGFGRSMTFTVDGAGDGLSGSITRWQGTRCEVLCTYPEASSLGNFYDRVIQMLGYGFTEEYKVMGLAPYGNPGRFKAAFERLYALLPQGGYAINWHLLDTLYGLVPLRKRGQPILPDHQDLAAALQQALETIVLHLLTHHRAASGMGQLCMAGGVAHNSTLNGRILNSGLFESIFVQPASSDAGCALGAALTAYAEANPGAACWPDGAVRHVFWGTDIGSDEAIRAQLERWRPIIGFQHVPDLVERTADALAKGSVVGWVQGRAEFGPRALGHRSILADPRPAANKDRVNAIVKKREGYRPFAPAVPEERGNEFFVLPDSLITTPFMSYTVQVQPQVRAVLGATTHVDGSARVQTVSRDVDLLFWRLLDAFGQRTGVPVLLNTSFNNHAEPIVDSVDDAIACYLTTGIDLLAVGPFLVEKRASPAEAMAALAPTLPGHVCLMKLVGVNDARARTEIHQLSTTTNHRVRGIGADTYRLLDKADGRRSTAALAQALDLAVDGLSDELNALWEERLIILKPATG